MVILEGKGHHCCSYFTTGRTNLDLSRDVANMEERDIKLHVCRL